MLQGKPGELFFFFLWGFTEKVNPLNKPNKGTPVSVPCLFPVPLFAGPARRLMATLKAKTIAFILSVVQASPQAVTLAQVAQLVTEAPPQGILN